MITENQFFRYVDLSHLTMLIPNFGSDSSGIWYVVLRKKNNKLSIIFWCLVYRENPLFNVLVYGGGGGVVQIDFKKIPVLDCNMF